MARRSRRDRRSAQTAGGAIPSPYIQRRVPHFDVLDDAQLQQLDQQVDWLIENIGVAFRDDQVALDIWRAAGVTPTGEHGDLIRADAQWIRDLVAKAPSQFTQISRNPARNVTIGGNHQVFAPIYGAPFVRDLEKGRRYAAFDDYEKLLKLVYLHPNLHHGGLVICEPTDIPV